jgi:outer membrane receptor protein involved in Fe transport
VRNTHTLTLGKRQTTQSAYVEVNVPLIGEANRLPFVRSFDLQTAGRREDYEVNTGTATLAVLPAPTTAPVLLSNKAHFSSANPTVGVAYRPVQSVMLRASFGQGFVAPSSSALMYNPTPDPFPTQIFDPKRGGTGYDVTTFSGGNPDLKPETSKSWNVGLVFEPTADWARGLRFNAEYTLIRKRNNISSLSAQEFVDGESTYASRITRATPAVGDPYGIGQITQINTTALNLLKAYVETFDLSMSYRKTTARFGAFDFTALATISNHYKQKTSLTTPMYDYAGYVYSGLKQQGNFTLSWDYHRWTAAFTTRYYSRYRIGSPDFDAATTSSYRQLQGSEYVPSQSYSDVFVAYRFTDERRGAAARWYQPFLRGMEVQVGINNVFRQIPPFDIYTFGSYPYSTYGDIRQREFRLSLKKPL